jgi:hypothetical protein
MSFHVHTPLTHYLEKIGGILVDGDMRLACVMLGLATILWGVLGLILRANGNPDLNLFASDFLFKWPVFWGLHTIWFGGMFIHIGVKNLPPLTCLVFGTYGVIIYTWIAMARPVASLTSGVVLNATVIVMSALLIHRSGRSK